MRRLLQSLSVLGLLVFGGLVYAPAAQGIKVFDPCAKDDTDSKVCAASDKDNAASFAASIINLLLWAIGIVAVFMIVIGGFKYVTSNGDANNIQSAKNTILYAVIGIAVALLGQAIVIFVSEWMTR